MSRPRAVLGLHSFISSRPNLTVAIICGVVVCLLLPGSWGHLTNILIAWNVAVWLYLISMAWLMMRAGHSKVRQIADQQDRSAPIVLVMLVAASIFSISAVLLELAQVKNLTIDQRLLHYAFTVSTVIAAWLLVGTLYTFHYAHLFYRSDPGARPLAFPDHECNPTYWDFLYFSFTISVAAQTSDVTVVSRGMRKIVLGQSILSFFFNAAILGLSINIAASVVGS